MCLDCCSLRSKRVSGRSRRVRRGFVPSGPPRSLPLHIHFTSTGTDLLLMSRWLVESLYSLPYKNRCMPKMEVGRCSERSRFAQGPQRDHRRTSGRSATNTYVRSYSALPLAAATRKKCPACFICDVLRVRGGIKWPKISRFSFPRFSFVCL